jgi:hypothetical protein
MVACHHAHMTDHYAAYMLRLWSVGDDVPLNWRASLEDPRTGERQVFGSIQALAAFLESYALLPPSLPPYDETPDSPTHPDSV